MARVRPKAQALAAQRGTVLSPQARMGHAAVLSGTQLRACQVTHP